MGFIGDDASSTMWLPSCSMSTSESTGMSSSPVCSEVAIWMCDA